MSTNQSAKYIQALNIARNADIGLPPRSKPGLMKGTTLYNLLRRAGWKWMPAVQEWVLWERPQKPEPEPAEPEFKHVLGSADNLFTIRIMAHKSSMPKITAELAEFAEVFNWEILSLSDPYDNHGEGDFCRVYLRIRIRS